METTPEEQVHGEAQEIKSNGGAGYGVDVKKEEDKSHHKQEENSTEFISSTELKDSSSTKQEEDQLSSAKAKMMEAREVNERLKHSLSKLIEEYQSLQKFLQALQQEQGKNPTRKAAVYQEENEETELVSLTLGRSLTETKKNRNLLSDSKDAEHMNAGLSRGLDCTFEPVSSVTTRNITSSESSIQEMKEEGQTETWRPRKVMKTMRSENEEVSQETQMKKARVSIRARCDTATMNDGCQWRKYGQKISKGNPCPRAYYRCTLSPNCPVRKQVQRCPEDMSILITTYEGTHNHILPTSATAMASATSAAVTMLQSGSSTSSQPGHGTSLLAPASASSSNLINGQNSITSSSQKNTSPQDQHFYFPNSLVSSSTSINSQSTVTLDLTSPSHYNRPGSSTYYYRALPQEHVYYNNQQYVHLNNQMTSSTSHQQQSLREGIAAATKALVASNPTFQTALAAAIKSYVGNGIGIVRDNPDLAEK